MKLTEREIEIIKMLPLSNSEIANCLGLSLSTIKTYLRGLFNKFPLAQSRTQILFMALKEQVIKLDEVKLHQTM